MLSVTKLLCDTEYFGDQLRYHPGSQGSVHGTTHDRGPVVVWNCTRTCNLKCIHCYSNSNAQKFSGELTHEEAKQFIDSLARFRVPVLLFSGGEPLLRSDLMQLLEYTRQYQIRATISTNGTLITREMARDLKKLGVGYVGISLDGIGSANDTFRGSKGAFDAALSGIHNCLEVDQRVGLRFTISRHNFRELPEVLRLVKEEGIPRVCFYHLVYSGRGSALMAEDISHQETREVMDLIIDWVLQVHSEGLQKEVLMVDNHADGVYLYNYLLKTDPEKAAKALQLLRLNGGNRSGIAIGEVDWYGNVHPDQFTMNHTLGNVRERDFGDIWQDLSHPIMKGLKNRRPLLVGRCTTCRWLDICNGNFRPRAEAVSGNFWEADPACFLTDAEIS